MGSEYHLTTDNKHTHESTNIVANALSRFGHNQISPCLVGHRKRRHKKYRRNATNPRAIYHQRVGTELIFRSNMRQLAKINNQNTEYQKIGLPSSWSELWKGGKETYEPKPSKLIRQLQYSQNQDGGIQSIFHNNKINVTILFCKIITSTYYEVVQKIKDNGYLPIPQIPRLTRTFWV